jgi:lon-related putative ATP-dependent protease
VAGTTELPASEALSVQRRLELDELYRECNPGSFTFETTSELATTDGTVGQDRALAALDFGLEIDSDGYNVFVSGPPGTGRNSTLRAVLARAAEQREVPPDWCYVYNFADHRQPSVLSLPPGRGPAFARDMDALVAACRQEISRAFDSEAYPQQREEMLREIQSEREKVFTQLEQEAREEGFAVSPSSAGIATVPLKPDGTQMSREEFAALPEGERGSLQQKGEALQPKITHAVATARRLDRDAQARIEELDRSVGLYAITPLLNELRQEYLDIPKATEYLEHVEADIISQIALFRAGDSPQQQILPSMPGQSGEEQFTRYRVNVLVLRDEHDGAPVVFEHHPTYHNLFGRVDYRSQFGSMSTDHTMIKAGSLHRANGGYLVLQAIDVLTTPLVWENLKRSIRCEEARIENPGEQFSMVPVSTLSPQPIPLDVKVIVVGTPYVHQVLQRSDEDFRKLFRVKADFTVDMPRSEAGVGLYSGFIAGRCKEDGLRPFDRTAVARVVEAGSRLAEHKNKLSTRFTEIADLVSEADYWAGEAKRDVVTSDDVVRAIDERVYRSNLIEERIQSVIEDGTIVIDTEGSVVGQVNGISVYDLGDYRFGRPSRITARVSLGRGQVVNIEREIQMSGRLHSKGFVTLNGYLNGTYARERQLSLAATIGFEQTYDEVDGDSASSAELYALLSALADVPIKQGIAVTGSVNQRGQVHAIGGVNEKIEGFFAVCRAKGLTGEQGVIIPRENVKHLMLRADVREAVREGKFHIWSVTNVDEGIELITGVPAGTCDARGKYPPETVNRKVVDAIARMARRLAASPRRGREAKKDGATEPKKDENNEDQN